MKEHKLYCCYSVPQKQFLEDNGIEYDVVALNKDTKCTMWIYIKDEKLDKYLKEWSQGSK